MKLSARLLIEHLRSLASQDKTMREAAKETGLCYTYICKLSNDHDIEFRRQRMADTPERQQRAADMRLRFENSETLEDIGKRYGLTRERVRQILTGRFGITAKDGGKAEQGRRARRERSKQREARSQKAWGCSYRDYRRIMKQPGRPTYAYIAQRRNARERGIGWEITLWQWWQTWERSGHWAERGRGRAYQMCRLNDKGPYAVDNVYIAPGDDNMRDYWVNKRAETSTFEVAQ